VAAGSLVDFDPAALPFVAAVTNPLPATDGVDPETSSAIRQQVPDAFRAITFRAVRPEDYARLAEQHLGWVQRAGGVFRWTGSWLTAFVTPDPRGAFSMSRAERREIETLLDRVRQAGRDAFALDPHYANLDLVIQICVSPDAHRGEVKALVLEALFGRGGVRPRPGFFSPDNFTFGTPLERSRLEAVIQAVPGVRAVERIQIRRRGSSGWRRFTELTFPVAENEVIRVENDRELPERGSVRLVLEGGA
jgi:predicted phage baseplate assembly protein